MWHFLQIGLPPRRGKDLMWLVAVLGSSHHRMASECCLWLSTIFLSQNNLTCHCQWNSGQILIKCYYLTLFWLHFGMIEGANPWICMNSYRFTCFPRFTISSFHFRDLIRLRLLFGKTKYCKRLAFLNYISQNLFWNYFIASLLSSLCVCVFFWSSLPACVLAAFPPVLKLGCRPADKTIASFSGLKYRRLYHL